MLNLTPKQERLVLNTITTTKPIGYGASRCVFNCNKIIKNILKLDAKRDYVIKLSCGLAGFNQQELEFKTFLNCGKKYLAEIVAKGGFIEIMEKVEVLHGIRDIEDYCGLPECGGDIFGYSEDVLDSKYDAETCDDIYYVYSKLNDMFGTTSDNLQLGRTQDYRVVAYDYGFLSYDNEEDIQERQVFCGSSSSNIYYNKKVQELYVRKICQLINEWIEFNGNVSYNEEQIKNFLSNIDAYVCDITMEEEEKERQKWQAERDRKERIRARRRIKQYNDLLSALNIKLFNQEDVKLLA